jgi:PAS domain S-box-containing protein/putative nucleotidyltransferase with HDIG domain
LGTSLIQSKQEEERLRKSEGLMASILEAIPYAVISLRERRIIFANKNVEAIFGWKPEELIGKSTKVLYRSEEEYEEIGRRFYSVLEKQQTYQEEFPCRRKDGKDIVCKVSISRIDKSLKEKKIIVVYEDITEYKRAEEEKKHLNLALQAVRHFNQVIIREKDRIRLLQGVCDELIRVGNYSAACISLFDESRRLVAIAEAGMGKEFLPMAESLKYNELPYCTQRALERPGVLMLVIKELSSTCADCPLAKKCHGKRLIITRLEYDGKVYGLLAVFAPTGFTTATKETESALFGEVAEDIAFALHDIELKEEHKRGLEKLQKTLEDTVHILALVVEMRDPYTAGHQRRVAYLARAIAKEIGLSNKQIKTIYMAGIVHDIGKISVPGEILSKPSKLSKAEIDLIKGHVQVGYDILKEIKFPWPIAQIVFQHHERMDGSGYPQGLMNEKILLEARVLGLADVVEAMTSHRPYRPALGIEKALEEISKNRGILYDPRVVDACLRLFTEKGFKFE